MQNQAITITLRGFNGPGWELSVTGQKPWVEKTLRKFIPIIRRCAAAKECKTE